MKNFGFHGYSGTITPSCFHFCKKEYSFVCATVQFDLIFLNSLILLDLNVLKILRNEYFSRIIPRYIESDTLGIRPQNNLGNSAASRTSIKTMIYKTTYFTESLFNATFSTCKNSIRNRKNENFIVHDFFSNIYHSAKWR